MVRRTVVSRCVARTTTGRFDGRGRCDACKETVVDSAKKANDAERDYACHGNFNRAENGIQLRVRRLTTLVGCDE